MKKTNNRIFSKPGSLNQVASSNKISDEKISINLFIIGFVSTAFQLMMIREMMNIAGGFELVAGTFLASWLIGSAIGAAIAGKSVLHNVQRINLAFSLSPILSLLLMFLLSWLYLNPGQTPSLLESIIFTFLVLLPFSFASGFTFMKLVSAAKSNNGYLPGKSFSIETVGGIVSGILVSILTAGILNTYQVILLIIVMSNGYVLLTYYLKSKRAEVSVRLLLIIISGTIIMFKPDIFFRQLLLPELTINSSEDTPYGNISKGVYKGESSTFYNHRLLSYQNDAAESEENIHYAMIQSRNPEKVILISGSLQSHLSEINKYPVKKIYYIERDPALTSLENYRNNSLTAKLTIINSDAFRFLKHMNEKADVIILLVPPPSTLLLNRYYTTEFFKETKELLNPGGIFLCSPGPGDIYLNRESIKLYSSIFNSLSNTFKSITPVPGKKLYFIASDNELSTEICKMIDNKNIKNNYVGSDYLSDDLIAQKSSEIKSLMDSKVNQNRAAFPVASYHFQSYNLSRNLNEKIALFILMMMLFAMPVTIVRRRNMMMYFSASALAGFEIIILITLQVTIGNMYQLCGLIIGGLMAGLAFGAATNNLIINTISLRNKGFILILFYIIFGLSYKTILSIESTILEIIILSLAVFLPAAITGNIFRNLTTKTNDNNASPATYSSDLSGSASGFIIISIFTVPLFGTEVSIYLLSLMIFAGILFGTITNKL